MEPLIGLALFVVFIGVCVGGLIFIGVAAFDALAHFDRAAKTATEEVRPARSWTFESLLATVAVPVLGVAALLFAGYKFFDYGVAHGFLSPATRTIAAALAAFVAIAFAEVRVRPRARTLADILTGAAFACLFVCIWLAREHFAFIDDVTAFALSFATMCTCVAASVRSKSFAIILFASIGALVMAVSQLFSETHSWLDLTSANLVAAMLLLCASTIALKQNHKWASYLLGGCSAVVLFAWLNFSIDAATAGNALLSFTVDTALARDVVRGIAWSCFALVLLAIGIRTNTKHWRISGLALVIITALKVCLHDASHFDEFFRIVALLALAITLIAVALAYRRFVFKSDKQSRLPA